MLNSNLKMWLIVQSRRILRSQILGKLSIGTKRTYRRVWNHRAESVKSSHQWTAKSLIPMSHHLWDQEHHLNIKKPTNSTKGWTQLRTLISIWISTISRTPLISNRYHPLEHIKGTGLILEIRYPIIVKLPRVLKATVQLSPIHSSIVQLTSLTAPLELRSKAKNLTMQ